MRREWHLLGLSIVIAHLLVSGILAQAFTFQGYLRQNNNPANGAYDFRFRLWNANTGGSQVGSDVFVDDVTVQNGLFTVELNFGSVWDGSPRFLEIAVRPGASTGGYQELAPRVKINPTPYAIRAATAGTANPIGTAGGDLSGSYPNPTVARLQGRAVASTAPSVGQVLKWDGSQWAPAPDLQGNTFWQASGSNIFYNAGNVGIGTNSPAHPLHVISTTGTAPVIHAESATAHTVIQGVSTAGWGVHGRSTTGTGVYGLGTATSGLSFGVYGETRSPDGYGGYFVGRGYFQYDSTTANATLRLHETASDFARLEFTNTNTARKWHIAALIGSTPADDRLNLWNSSAGDVMTLTGNGRVSIGWNPPGARLHVQGESGNRSTAIITGSGGQLATDWPAGWDGGLATWDICAQSIRYSTLSSRSDERLKRDITPLNAQYELQRLLQLRPVSYFWRDERLHKAVGEQPQFGFIAQELREVFPELVQEGGEDNILAVNYQALIPLLVNAIQLQQREIEQLRAEVQQLRAQVKR